MRGKAGRFSRLVFTPDMLSGLTGWWDATDASTLYDATSGGSLVAADGAIARWEDKTGNGRHFTQATSDRRPLRKTSVLNGLDIVRFDGSNDRMTNSAIWSALFAATAGTAFLVAKATTVTTNNASIFNNQMILSETGGSHGFFVTKSDNTVASYGYDSDFQIASQSFTPDTWIVFSSWHDGSNLRASINGGSPASDTLGTRTFTNFAVTIGMDVLNVSFFDGDVAEIITYNVALSDSDRASVESYLSSKYAIS